ncbi:MAG TPA: hypothetical protein VFL91_18255, partial [Thermomicrobiales bacterium]|nr:hypothetical protein [Thermomicrobiales bacterium]
MRARGTRRARERVARLTRAAGLVGRRRRRVGPTVAAPARVPAPHPVGRARAAPAPGRPRRGDSTAAATRAGRPSLAAPPGAPARRAAGRAAAARPRAAPARAAPATAPGR